MNGLSKKNYQKSLIFNDNFSIVKNVVERVRNYVAVSRLRQGILWISSMPWMWWLLTVGWRSLEMF